MKKVSFYFISFFTSYAFHSASQDVETIDLYPYDAPFATGYVNPADSNFSGDMEDISGQANAGYGFNSGFVVFDASKLPAGAAIVGAVLTLYPTNSLTYIGSSGFAHATSIPVNPVNGAKITKKEIRNGAVYADRLDWSATIIAPINSDLNTAGIAALQKKIGAAFAMGIDPPTSTGNVRGIAGYQSTSTTTAQKPSLKVSYNKGSPSGPNADFSVNTRDTFPNSEVTFFDNSGNYPTSWLWEFGDDSTSTLQNPKHAYADTGYYSVILTVKNAQGQDSIAKEKFIRISPIPPPPIAEFAVDLRNIAVEETVSFTDLSLGYITEWKWRFGDNENSSEQNPDHTYAENGVYTVRLIVSSPFGSDTMLKEDFMNVGGEIIEPVADFSFDNSKGLTVHFFDLCKNFPDEWAWNFGDGGTDAVQNPVHTYAAEGTYKVCVDATNPAGTNKLCKEVFGIKTGMGQATSNSDQLSVYPNPATEKLVVELSGTLLSHPIIKLYDMMGRSVLTRSAFSGKAVLDLSAIPKGMYILKWLSDDMATHVKKVVKN